MIRKPAVIVILLGLFSCYSSPFRQSTVMEYSNSLDAFEYTGNFSEGLVLHYIKSNPDGSFPAQVDICFPDPLRSESFKIYPGSRREGATFLIKAEYDAENFCISNISGNYVRKNGEIGEYAQLAINDGRTATVNLIGTDPYRFELMHTPSFIFNFDLADLNTMFRYIRKDVNNLNIGIIGHLTSMQYVYSGTVEIVLIKDDSDNNQLVYSIGGEGFGSRSGTIIVDRKDRYVREYNIPMSTGSPYAGFLFRLQSVSHMSPEEWREYIIKQTEEALN